MSWIFLVIAIALEIAGTVCMKKSDGCKDLWLSAAMLGLYALGLGAMALAVQGIDVSIAYALWAGIGVAGVAVVFIVWFKEPVSILKVVSLLAIVIGVIGLNYSLETPITAEGPDDVQMDAPAKQEALAVRE